MMGLQAVYDTEALLDLVALDVLQMPLDDDRRYILVVVDIHTKKTWAVPLTGKSSEEIWD